MIRDYRGTWLPPRRLLGIACAVAAVIALSVLAVEMYQRSVVAAQRMTLGAVGSLAFYPGVPTKLRIVAYDDLLGAPLEGVKVSAEIRAEAAQEPRLTIPVSAVSTDAAGSALLEIALPVGTPVGRYQMAIRGSEGADRSELVVPVTVEHGSRRVALAVDKLQYRPGETIRMRGLLRGADQLPAAGVDVVFEIRDPRGTLIASQRRSTSAFGIASAELGLANAILSGEYRVMLRAPSGASEQTVRVASNRPSELDVNVSFDRGGAVPGQPLTGVVHAGVPFAGPVSGARARVTGTRRGGVKETHTGETDAEGRFLFHLESPPGIAFSDVVVEVSKDVIGHRSVERDVPIASTARSEEPLYLHIVPEAEPLIRGQGNRIYVVVRDEQRRPVAATLRGVAQKPFTVMASELGVAAIEVEPGAFASRFDVEVTAEDVLGRWGFAAATFAVDTDDGAFRLRTDRVTYAPGDEIRLSARSALPGTIYVDMVDARRTLASTSFEVASGRGEGALAVPENATGVVELRAFRLRGPFRTSHRDARVFITPKGQLDVRLTLDAETYRPGEDARVDVLVLDADGKPVQAALGLVAVDRALLGDYEALPGTERLLLRSDVSQASPELRPLLVRTDAISEERDAQRVLLAAADVPSLRRPTVRFGRSGEARRIDRRWSWEARRWRALRVVSLGALGIALALLLAIARNAWGASARVHAERPVERSLRAWTRLAAAAAVSTLALAALHAQVTHWRSTVVFGVYTALFAGSGALLWMSAQHMAASRGLGRLGWSVCAMHILVHGASLLTLGFQSDGVLYGVEERLVVGGAALLMLLTTVAVGTARGAYLGSRPPAVAAVAILLTTAGLVGVGAVGFDRLTRRYVDRLDADQRLLRELTMAETNVEQPGHRTEPEEPRVDERQRPVYEVFPDPLLWRPEVLTDGDGRARLSFPVADSVTTWSVGASAVGEGGRAGSAWAELVVDGAFTAATDVPRDLSVGDEVSAVVEVSNHQGKEQDFVVVVDASDGVGVRPAQRRVRVAGRGSEQARFQLRARAAGEQAVTIRIEGESTSDEVKRPVSVHRTGREIVEVRNGTVSGTERVTLDLPDGAADEGRSLEVKLYPGQFSQLVEGIRGVLEQPYGSLVPTISTTYPSVLALSFLQQHERADEPVAALAPEISAAGYQRLLYFELPDGGFSRFGYPLAELTPTAYAFMLLEDLARVRTVDPQVAERTRAWLMAKQSADGRWDDEEGAIRRTAFIAWALADSGVKSEKLGTAFNHVAKSPGTVPDDPYVLALRANALIAADRTRDARGILDRLLHLRTESGSWRTSQRTLLFSRGRSADEETTALVALALLRAKRNRAEADAAIAWLLGQRTSRGTWHSTPATVAAMRVILERQPPAPDSARVSVHVNEQKADPIAVSGDGSAHTAVELGTMLQDGRNTVQLVGAKAKAVPYQIALSYLVAHDRAPESDLALTVSADREQLAPGETITVNVQLEHRGGGPPRLPIVELGVPPGMDVVERDLGELVASDRVMRWERRRRHLVLYLPSAQTLPLAVRLRARNEGRMRVPASRAYDYYDADVRAEAPPIELVVR